MILRPIRSACLAVLMLIGSVGVGSAYGSREAWPTGVSGPFVLDRVEHLRIRSFDGTILDGVVAIPRLPAGVRAPVVLQVSPYNGTLDGGGEDPNQQATSGRPLPVPRDRLISEGYAVAYFNVRGTGASGGCFDFFGLREQQDTELIVEDLARRAWANGRVGMIGLSYDGTTPFEAAARQADGLETIVVSGITPDLYGTLFSPQGSPIDDQWPGVGAFYGAVSAAARRSPPQSQAEFLLEQLSVEHERLCPEVARWLTRATTDFASADREEEFYAERNLLSRFGDIRTAVLLAHGFQDHITFGEDAVWAALTGAPKYQLEGQWGHEMPSIAGWEGRLVDWFDYWLKQQGPPPAGLGRVDFQDDSRVWHQSLAWPPPEAVEEALGLEGPRMFRAAPDAALAEITVDPRSYRGSPVGQAPACPPFDGVTSVSYLTEKAPEKVVVAGNPRALLHLSSDSPEGRFTLRLFRVSPDFTCEAGRVAADDFRYLGGGAVDLRFHAGNLSAIPFPVGTPVAVRVDIPSMAETLAPGDRVLAVLGLGPEKTGVPGMGMLPTLTIHSGELVLPVVRGTLGLGPPVETYPPRPRG